MKLTTRGHYGLMALAHLALKADQGPIPLRVIAASENIPEQYLEQLFVDLRKANLIKSIRGAKGGYTLARNPSDIIVGEAIRVLEGPIAPVDCLRDHEPDCCDKTSHCATKMVWEKLKHSMVNVLDDLTLEDIVNQELVVEGDKGGAV
ncbi:RrF2 family transcriptional regulator [Desulfuribacillus alkaliarsenatis]|uniref:AsnC family transcriptional regulator n=1 Tax=Desulfuribacillus alkaliarsenatis TaxID=766136 RepID=A0A1E5G4W3_9FIRM|nr:Rrf2 family transcriptional regulator [Desulfuribacillus alkaliarsenatis]OEF98220.1 AsnC family transcriptional regulator [Desulfuribacillus alkaliarsenatis]